jgi:ATP-dependent DNA helicase RecQ
MLGMYTACPAVKVTILQSILENDETLCVIVATIAFGMGLDCPNNRRVIHWGHSGDSHTCRNRTSWAGQSFCYTNIDCGKICDDAITKYCRNKTTCRKGDTAR